MKIIRFKDLNFTPASHEDPKDPGVLKKILFEKDDLILGRVQMINWTKIPAGKSFSPHYHQDMDEVFIIIKGQAEVRVDQEIENLGPGDSVILPMQMVQLLKNIGKEDLEYLVIGISKGLGGKTILSSI